MDKRCLFCCCPDHTIYSKTAISKVTIVENFPWKSINEAINCNKSAALVVKSLASNFVHIFSPNIFFDSEHLVILKCISDYIRITFVPPLDMCDSVGYCSSCILFFKLITL